MLKKISSRPFPLPVLASFWLALIAMSLVVAFGIYVYFEKSNIKEKAIEQTFAYNREVLQQRSDERLSPLVRLSNAGISIPFFSDFDTQEKEKILEQFITPSLNILAAYPKIYSLGYAYNGGQVLLAFNVLQLNANPNNLNAPSDAVYGVLHRFETYEQNQSVQIHYFSGDFTPIENTVYSNTYNPAGQAWYHEMIASKNVSVLPYQQLTSIEQQAITIGQGLSDKKGIYFITTTIPSFLNLLSSTLDNLNSSLYLLEESQYNILSFYVARNASELSMLCSGKIELESGYTIDGTSQQDGLICNHKKIFQQIVNNSKKHDADEEIYSFTANQNTFYYSFIRLTTGTTPMPFLLLLEEKNIAFDNTISTSSLVIFAIIIFVALVGIFYYFMNNTLHPLEQLLDEAKDMQPKSKNSGISFANNFKEVSKLKDGIDELKKSMQDEISNLKQYENLLEHNLEENSQYLAEAIDLAQETLHNKINFSNEISRELRTPLHAILGFTHVFQTDNLTPEQISQLEKIRLSTYNLLNISNYIIDCSNFESSNVRLEKKSFSLSELLENLKIYTTMARNIKEIEIIINKDDDIPDIVLGDPPRVFQILQILVDHAMETTEHGAISILVKRNSLITPQTGSLETMSVSFEVCDQNTVMVNQEDIKKLTSLTYNFSASQNQYFKGSYIGFGVAKMLTEEMQGKLLVNPKSEGGVCFHLTLNLEIVTDNHVLEQQKKFSPPTQIQESTLALVVDDNKINLEVSSALLRKMGVGVHVAQSGMEAIEKIKKYPYQIIFMDIQMPEMDGYETSKQIRKLQDVPQNASDVLSVPIFAMTANVRPEDIQKSYEAGMDGHIAKPIVPNQLFDLINNQLAK